MRPSVQDVPGDWSVYHLGRPVGFGGFSATRCDDCCEACGWQVVTIFADAWSFSSLLIAVRLSFAR